MRYKDVAYVRVDRAEWLDGGVREGAGLLNCVGSINCEEVWLSDGTLKWIRSAIFS